jgi:hypothetical protein
MLVFGDRSRSAAPQQMLRDLRAGLHAITGMPGGVERHGRLVSLFIAAGELAQGVADAEFAKNGFDAPSPAQQAGARLLLALASAIRASWESAFAAAASAWEPALDALAPEILPQAAEIKRPEGYAFYALYPESYLAAASALDGVVPTKVVGIRSIGTGLAAMVAARLGGEPPATVRPIGEPFRRELAVSPNLAAALLHKPDASFAVVDEGPGLSGSSFGAVADFLEERGVAPKRIHFFPSHEGELGPQASPRHLRRWRSAQRHVVDFDALVLRAPKPAHRLENWVADLVGQATEALVDISGGDWRAQRYGSEEQWPAAHVQQERRKFLLRSPSGTWLLKFAGLGEEGERKLERARRLAAAGFCPEVVGYRYGFLVERWIEGASPLTSGGATVAAFAERIGEYLSFRAVELPAAPGSGATLAQLFQMAMRNTALGLGQEPAARLERWRPRLAALESRVGRVEADNRLQRWEWLRLPDGRLLKTDAVDHHAAHDLVGCQDILWDVAGATVELGFAAEDVDVLYRRIERATGRGFDRELLALLTRCYLAFWLGYWTLAGEALVGFPPEVARIRRERARYAELLRNALLSEA